MEAIIKKRETPLKVLFEGWVNIPHSYAICFCFQLIHLYKNYGPNGVIKINAIEFYVKEAEYYNPEWNSKKKLVYTEEYNNILNNLKKWDGEEIDVIYRQTYPYNINVTNENKDIPKCIFYTSEFAQLNSGYFRIEKPISITEDKYDEYIILFLKEFNNIYFTSPSEWSSRGMIKYLENKEQSPRNRIITHGVDTSIFKKDLSNRELIREKYNIKKNDILMINIGAMTTNKGILLILEVLNILVNKMNKTHYKLMLKGSGDLYKCQEFLEIYFEQFKTQGKMTEKDINNLLNNNIIFTNKTLSYSRINDLYNASDLYISPYLCEGFNLTVLESLSSGLNVLVPRTGSTKEYIEEIYNNDGSEYITYVDSEVAMDSTGMCENIITVENILNTLVLNESKLKLKKPEQIYNKMMKYIKKDLSWDKVSELLFNYFRDILELQKQK
jgi:glycosyltransferase involved in cell wall biosynthesis